jgi:Ni/Co efflux regulator RcnB
MTRTAWIMTIAAAVTLAAAAPAAVMAQGASAGARANQQHGQQAARQGTEARQRAAAQRERASQRGTQRERAAELERQRERDRRGQDRDIYRRQQQAGGGPAFCRSGSGHPVFGRQWCREKGFGLGMERRDLGRAGDIIIGRRPRDW